MANFTYDYGIKTLLAAQPEKITTPALVKATLEENWHTAAEAAEIDEPVAATLTVGDPETEKMTLKPTKRTMLSLASGVSISKGLLLDTPRDLLAPVLNFWLSTAPGEAGPSFTVDKDNVATALVKGSAKLPLSTVAAATAVADAIVDQGVVDDHDGLEFSGLLASDHLYTAFRVLAGNGMLTQQVTIDGDEDPDLWSGGVQVVMSSSGHTPASISAYVQHDDSGYGMVLPGLSFKYSVRKHGKTPEAVLEWLEECVGMILLDLPGEMEKISHMPTHDISEDIGGILTDVLTRTNLPAALRALVVEEVEEGSGDDAYSLLRVFTDLEKDETDPVTRERIMEAAGRLQSVLLARCPTCHQIKN